ncbi:MAG: response regulator transcription factor [Kiritimatiellae bacterium]|nr:response regulator transcription factor [Kiritimatiellia bacterium]
MPDAKIFIVEDDTTIRTVLELALAGAEYRDVSSFGRGDDALEAIRAQRPDLVLLDLMLPGVDGLTIARRVREEPGLSATRIVMLTAKTRPDDVVRGLEAGADDYVTKPFDRRILLARIAAVLRRSLPAADGVEMDGLVLDVPNRAAKLDGAEVKLPAGEFDLLARLVSRRGRIIVRHADERSMDVQIANLRKKLGAWASRIETIRGIGYRVCG